MDDLTHRNFKALSDGLKAERTKNENLAIKVTTLEQTISQLQSQMTQMQLQLTMGAVAGLGSGATS